MELLVRQSGRITGMQVTATSLEIAKKCSICLAALSHSTGTVVAIQRSRMSGAQDQ